MPEPVASLKAPSTWQWLTAPAGYAAFVLVLGMVICGLPSGCIPGSAAQPAAVRAATPAFDERLEQVRQRKIGFEQARAIVWEAGESHDVRYARTLREIAAAWSCDTAYYKVAFDALHSLWLMGEPREYFLRNLRDHSNNQWLAYYSAHVLGYSPDNDLARVLEEIRTGVTDEYVRGQINQVRFVVELRRQLTEQSTPQAKAKFLVRYCGMGFTELSGGIIEGHEPSSSLRPEAVWARLEMARISREQPDVVRDAIEQHSCLNPRLDGRYRDYIRQTISDAAETLKVRGQPLVRPGPE